MTRRIKSKTPLDMYNMVGYCPPRTLNRNVPYMFRNLVDASDTDVQTKKKRLIHLVGHEVLGINPAGCNGLVLHSGSEANEVALQLIKTAEPKRRVVLASMLCHSSLEYACSKLGLKLIKLPVGDDFRVSTVDIYKAISKYHQEVLAFVVTYGTTKFGTEDMVPSQSMLTDMQSNGIQLHVDAAYGGMILGLSREDKPTWLKSTCLKTVSVDMHKFIGPLGCSVLITPDKTILNGLGHEVKYFEGAGTQLGTTRSSYPMVCSLDMLEQYGFVRLCRLANRCISRARIMGIHLEKLGLYPIAPINSGVVPIRLHSEKQVKLYVQALLDRGFKVSPIIADTGATQVFGIRIVITPKREMSDKNLRKFLASLASVTQQLPTN